MINPSQITPNELESAIMMRMAVDVPALNMLIGKLHVLSREFTGVGSFTNFAVDISSADLPDGFIGLNSASISIPGVPSGLVAELAIESGSPRFLELVTYGSEPWDGTFAGFSIDNVE